MFSIIIFLPAIPFEVSNQSHFISHIAPTSERGGETDAGPHLTARSHFRHSASVDPRPAQEEEDTCCRGNYVKNIVTIVCWAQRMSVNKFARDNQNTSVCQCQ